MKRAELIFKYLFFLTFCMSVLTYFYKDKLPTPSFYDAVELTAPLQVKTLRDPFTVYEQDQQYQIFPLYDYELHGVVVSITKAGQLGDIWHFKRWKDFLNVRDICVIWGKNVSSGLYQKMSFKSDTWTCWYQLPDFKSAKQFEGTGLSNNHLLTEDYLVKKQLMKAELGDHIYLKGVLAEYRNPGNNFYRKTSTNRYDTGNGACETIYLDEFKIIKKANPAIRRLYTFSFWMMIISGILFVICFVLSPVKMKH